MPTITIVPGTDTVNQMRIAHNDNDTALKTETEQATADIAAHKAAQNTDHDGRYSKITDLNTHKTSTDHDGRYYTEGEIDAAVVKLTGDQTVAGAKTLTSNPAVKNATPAYDLIAADGTPIGRVLGQLVGGEDNRVALQVYDKSASQYFTALSVNEDGSIQDGDGNVLATRSYSDLRTKSWRLAFSFSIVQTIAANQSYVLTPARIIVPQGARLISVLNAWDFSGWPANSFWANSAASYVFSQSWMLRVVLRTGTLSGSDLPVHLDVDVVTASTDPPTGWAYTNVWTAQIGTVGATDVDGTVTLLFSL